MKTILFVLFCPLAIALFSPRPADAQCRAGRCPAASAAVEAPILAPMPDQAIRPAKPLVSVLAAPITIAANSRQRRIERDGWYVGKWTGKAVAKLRCR